MHQSEPCEVFGFCGAAVLLRRSALAETGYFNPRFRFLCEDVELSWRLRLLGHGCWYVPDAHVAHVGGATLRQFPKEATFEGVRNALYTLLTCAPRWYFGRYWRGILRLYWRLALRCISEGHTQEVLRAFGWMFLHAAEIGSRRRALQGDARSADVESLERLLYRGEISVNFPSGPAMF